MSELAQKLQALLFIYGDPIAISRAAQILGVSKEEVIEAGQELAAKLSEGGLALITQGDQLQLTTKPEFSKLLGQVMKAELHESLTPAALETLSIITYAAPISRAEIDYIRGVNSTYTLRALSLRGLIDRDADPKRANAYVYAPSLDLIKHLGVTGASELPEYEKFRQLAQSIRATPAAATEQKNTDAVIPAEAGIQETDTGSRVVARDDNDMDQLASETIS